MTSSSLNASLRAAGPPATLTRDVLDASRRACPHITILTGRDGATALDYNPAMEGTPMPERDHTNPTFKEALEADQTVPAAPPAAPEDVRPKSSDDGEFIRFRRRTLYAFLLPLAFVAGVAAGYLMWGSHNSPSPAVVVAGTPTAPTRVDVSISGDPEMGPENAPITIVEFSDFNCPYCQRFAQSTFKTLMDAYPDKIRFVYRNFPITSQESFVAAQAALCARDQGAYWPFHDALFSGQLQLGHAAYKQYAQQLGLDADALIACVDSGKYADKVQQDAHDAAGYGVTGTPTFFINGIPLVGAQPMSEFKRVIDGELQ